MRAIIILSLSFGLYNREREGCKKGFFRPYVGMYAEASVKRKFAERGEIASSQVAVTSKTDSCVICVLLLI